MADCIGVFDSGVGGVSVLREAVRLLPHESFIFYGDNQNAPYGPRPVEEIRRLCAAAVDHLLSQDIKALVIACNTATSAYASILRQTARIPVIGMEPALKPAHFARSDGRILALATRATLSLDKFSALMACYGEGVIPVEGRGLVEIVESGKADSAEARAALAEVLAPYLNEKIDAVVLGCTHYPFLRRQIESFFPAAQFFDGLEGTVRQLERRLRETDSLAPASHTGSVAFQSSGGEDKIQLMHRLFKADI